MMGHQLTTIRELAMARVLTAVVAALVAVTLMGCETTYQQAFTQPIAKAHNGKAWRSQKAFESEIVVTFGDNTMLDGTMLMTTSMDKVRFDLRDRTVLVYDGQAAWVSPAASEQAMARFHLLTWPYFVASPYKLADPGTYLQSREDATLTIDDKAMLFNTAKLTFAEDVGDTPDDWYVIYRDAKSNRLRALAYIVTYGNDKKKAESEPHAVVFDRYRVVDGVPIPTEWAFYNWTVVDGLVGDPIGSVRLVNPRFVVPRVGLFDKPTDARADLLPGS
jgi:hypothetical protein